MVGRILAWTGGLVAVVSVVGLTAYFAKVGFKLTDTLGIIGAGLGISGLVVGMYGLVLTRRDATQRAAMGSSPGRTGTGRVSNRFTGGTVNGPLIMGRDISGPFYGGAQPKHPSESTQLDASSSAVPDVPLEGPGQ
jgi:hypothetical protein